MTTNWSAWLENNGATLSERGVEHFTHSSVAVTSPPMQAQLVPLLHLCTLEFHGADATEFLQSQLTNDVSELVPMRWQRGAYCNVKGRVIANFLLCRGAESYAMVLSASLGDTVRVLLQKFVLRMKVSIQRHDGVLLGMLGADAMRVAQAIWHNCAAIEEGSVRATGTNCLLCLGQDKLISLVALDDAPAVWNTLAAQARPAGRDEWDAHEIARNIPLITYETQGMFLPQMLGLDQLGAVSFRKGCFPGQEIVARARYLGEVKRHLRNGIAALTAVACAGQPVFGTALGTEQVGVVVNAARLVDGRCAVLAVINDAQDASRGLFLDGSDNTRVQLHEQVVTAHA